MAKKLKNLKRLISAGEKSRLKHRTRHRTPLWIYWEEFVEKYLRLGKSKTTVQNVKDALRWLIFHLNIMTIEECNDLIKLEDVMHEYRERRRIKETTFNSYRKNLNTYFIWLERYGYIEENPIKRIPKMTEKSRSKLVINDEKIKEIVFLLKTRRQTRLERARNIFFIDLLRFTGARPVELADLTTEDIVPFQGTYKLTIHGAKQKGKMRHYRLIGYVRDSYEAYMGVREQLGRKEKPLLISQSRLTGWGQKGMRYLFKKLSTELGFPITAYSFRRYVATKLYANNQNLSQIGDYLGHTRVSTTRKYLDEICAWTDGSGEIMAG